MLPTDAEVPKSGSLGEVTSDHWSAIIALLAGPLTPPRWVRTRFVAPEEQAVDMVCSGTIAHQVVTRAKGVVGYLSGYGTDSRNQFCHVTFAFTSAISVDDQAVHVGGFVDQIMESHNLRKVYMEIWPEQLPVVDKPGRYSAQHEGTLRDFAFRAQALSDVVIVTWSQKVS